MQAISAPSPWRMTVVSMVIGGVGAALAWAASAPAPVLIGPAVLVSVAGLAGIPVGIADRVRDGCFVVLGLGIGAGFDTDAGAALMRWPLAFVALALGLYVTMVLCQFTLRRGFGFDRRSAILASAPGHLSFVLSIAASSNADVGRIAVVQSIRLLALTLIVPFAALAMGFPIRNVGVIGGAPMSWPALALLCAVGLGVGLIFLRLRLPAPLLLGGMAVSGGTHITGMVPGGVPPVILVPAFLVLGVLIGSRFSGMTLARLRGALVAGMTITLIASVLAGMVAIPIAYLLTLPLAHVLAAFAPGGLETMIALGATLGADPGFVAACHIMRLLILTALIPLALGRTRLST